MRILFWFLLLAAAAVAVALAAKVVNGYVLFVAPPYRIELSLNLFLVLIAVGFAHFPVDRTFATAPSFSHRADPPSRPRA